MGSSLIVRLEEYLRRKRAHVKVPIPVTFIGKSGLQFSGLRGLLEQALVQQKCKPAIIILHLGANDICRVSALHWQTEMEAAVLYVKELFPSTQLIWSDMLPRLNWRSANSFEGGEAARKKGQRKARYFVSCVGGSVIRHPYIQFGCLMQDGVHLNEAGNAEFVDDLANGVMAVLHG